MTKQETDAFREELLAKFEEVEGRANNKWKESKKELHQIIKNNSSDQLTKIIPATDEDDFMSFDPSSFQQDVPSQKWDVEKKPFPISIFENLPTLLKEAVDVFIEQKEKEVFFISAIGVLSGMLPNYYSYYDAALIGANLYVYIVGNYGEGKGSMSYAMKLGQPIHSIKLEISKQTAIQNEISQSKNPFARKNLMLFIPANNTKSGLLQLLVDNNGRGIIMESEGDTLVNALKTEHGKFSDMLRKAFHHETISSFRKTESEHYEIKEPYLSCIISSTIDQLQRLIPTTEDGLFSRFIYYQLETTKDFRDVFDSQKQQYSNQITEIAQRVATVYKELESRKEPIYFELTTIQKENFNAFFSALKSDWVKGFSEELGGTANRLGIICYRICMILSLFRNVKSPGVPSRIICADLDFENALEIMKILVVDTLSIHSKLSKPKDFFSKEKNRLQRMARVHELHEAGYTLKGIVEATGTSKSSAQRWIQNYRRSKNGPEQN